MSAQFIVKNIYNLGEMYALAGEVKSGPIAEGDIGSTWSNKKFTIVKIETKDGTVRTAQAHDRVTLVVRNILRVDLRIGETLYIE